MKFPIEQISKNSISDIVSLLELKQLGKHKFIAIIPIVKRITYRVYNLIAHPIRVMAETLMIAEIDDTFTL